MFTDKFWIALAFVVCVGLLLKKFKQAILGTIDAKIEAVEQKIAEAATIRKECSERLSQLQEHYAVLLRSSNSVLAKARADAEAILDGARTQVQDINSKNLVAMQELQRHEDSKLLAGFKSEIMMSVLTMIQRLIEEMPNAKRMSMLGDSLKGLRKTWH